MPALFPSLMLGWAPISVITRVGEEDARPNHLVERHND